MDVHIGNMVVSLEEAVNMVGNCMKKISKDDFDSMVSQVMVDIRNSKRLVASAKDNKLTRLDVNQSLRMLGYDSTFRYLMHNQRRIILDYILAQLYVSFNMEFPDFVCMPTKDDLDKVIERRKGMMKISRPIMVAGIDILVASEEDLVSIIREAKQEINSNEDLAIISVKFRERAVELKEIISLCVEQLDKRHKNKSK